MTEAAADGRSGGSLPDLAAHAALGKKLECLSSARRIETLDRLAALGPTSVAHLANLLGGEVREVFHHLRALAVAELVEVVAGENGPVRDRVYAATARRTGTAQACRYPDLRASLARVADATSKQLARDYANGLSAARFGSDGSGQNLTFGRLVGHLDREQLAMVNAAIEEICEALAAPPSSDAECVSFGWVMAPVPPAR